MENISSHYQNYHKNVLSKDIPSFVFPKWATVFNFQWFSVQSQFQSNFKHKMSKPERNLATWHKILAPNGAHVSKVCLIVTDNNCLKATASNSIFTSVSILNHFLVTKTWGNLWAICHQWLNTSFSPPNHCVGKVYVV